MCGLFAWLSRSGLPINCLGCPLVLVPTRPEFGTIGSVHLAGVAGLVCWSIAAWAHRSLGEPAAARRLLFHIPDVPYHSRHCIWMQHFPTPNKMQARMANNDSCLLFWV